ncbi:hypothetical protein [Nocardia sp. NPDC050718]|uniref:hypothetical protein n=1 Tax=Nocardia sp. NPDC050718 TaxID=3155788 RepID=UPI0033D79C3D
MTSQVATVQMAYATRTSTGGAPVDASAWTLRGVGAIRVLYGLVPFAALILGVEVGTGLAVPVFVAVGLVSVLLGLATVALAPRLLERDDVVLASVSVDAVLVVLGVAALMVGWAQFTVAAAAVVLGGVVLAALSAAVVAIVTAVRTA